MAESTDPQPLPYVPLQPFTNDTIATGGDSLLYNLNVFYNVRVPRSQRAAPHSLAPALTRDLRPAISRG
jgi:hypothetical protein